MNAEVYESTLSEISNHEKCSCKIFLMHKVGAVSQILLF